MNWAAAAVIFTVVAFVGMPQVIENQFQVKSDAEVTHQQVIAGSVVEGSPADKAGIEELDVITSINGEEVTTSAELREVTSANAGKQVEVTYERDGQSQTTELTLGEDISKGALGVSPGDTTVVKSTWSAPIVGIGTTIQLTIETYKGIFTALGNLLTGHGGQASQSVTGPVGIFVILKSMANQGLTFVLFLIGILSLSLAVFNSLPIPALDGGRLFVMGLFRVLRKPLSKEMEEKIHGTGMAVLLLLAVLITVVDIRRL